MPDAIPVEPGHVDVSQGLAAARAALQRDGLDAALDVLAALRAQFPDATGPVLQAEELLRQAGRLDEAEAWLTEARVRFPDDAAVAAQHARSAQRRGDLDAAAQRWQAVRATFPDDPAGHFNLATVLREARQFDAAEHAVAQGLERFPENAGLRMESAWVAHARGDWPLAARRWQDALRYLPDHSGVYMLMAQALQSAGDMAAAEALLADAIVRFPDVLRFRIDQAWMAHTRQDWAAADARWAALRVHAPDCVAAYTGAAHAFRQAGRPDEAERVLGEAIQQFPDDAALLSEYASSAGPRADWDAAARRWGLMLTRFPDRPEGYGGMAAVLRATRQWEQREQFIGEAIGRFPDHVGLAVDHAWAAYDRGDGEAAIQRWRRVCERFPEQVEGHAGLGLALREFGSIDEAEQVIGDAKARFPDDGGLLIGHAAVANRRRMWADAVLRWEAVRTRFPREMSGYVDAALPLRELRRFDEADELLVSAMQRFPQQPKIFLEHAENATRRGDWDIALRRLVEARRRFPREVAIQRALHEAQLRGVDETAEPAASAAGEAATADEDNEMRTIVSAFISLGGEHRGCEFGEIQRVHGAEPLGLLRWTHAPPTNLMIALEERFEGMGKPEQTRVFPHSFGDLLEYQVADQRFGLGTHTYIRVDDAPQEAVAKQTYRRIQYLRRELIDDLESGDKIFVYKTSARNLNDEEIERLFAGVRRYSPGNTLLYVRYADAAHPDGSVEVVRPGLMIGYLDRFGAEPSGALTEIPFASWTALCRQAFRLWRDGMAAPAA